MLDFNKTPSLIPQTFVATTVGDIKEDLCSRQVVTIPFIDSEFETIFLNVSEKEIYDNISKDGDYIDYSKIPDEEIRPCEYNCSSNSFVVPVEYMTYIKRRVPSTIKVIVYGIEYATDEILPSIKNAAKTNFTLPSVEDISIEGNEIDYVTYKNPLYNSIEKDGKRYFILNTNLPYKFYSKIALMDSTFTYDINTHKFYDDETPMDLNEIVPRFLKIHNEDIRNGYPQTYILANNANLRPSHMVRSGSDIFLAKFLRIPYIPASLVVSDAPIPFSTNKTKKNRLSVYEVNELCKPFFIFPE